MLVVKVEKHEKLDRRERLERRKQNIHKHEIVKKNIRFVSKSLIDILFGKKLPEELISDLNIFIKKLDHSGLSDEEIKKYKLALLDNLKHITSSLVKRINKKIHLDRKIKDKDIEVVFGFLSYLDIDKSKKQEIKEKLRKELKGFYSNPVYGYEFDFIKSIEDYIFYNGKENITEIINNIKYTLSKLSLKNTNNFLFSLYNEELGYHINKEGKRIFGLKEMKDDLLLRTLLHESIHFIFAELGLKESNNEYIVELLNLLYLMKNTGYKLPNANIEYINKEITTIEDDELNPYERAYKMALELRNNNTDLGYVIKYIIKNIFKGEK